MSKFNKTSTQVKAEKRIPNSVNAAGGASYTRDSIKQDIATTILTSMLKGDSFYETESARLARIESMIAEKEVSEFSAKAMVYARNVGNLRSISHYLATLLAENVKGSTFLRPALRKSFVRPDDLTETLALWNSRNSENIPNVLRRAFKDSLETFDNYQLRKYAGEKRAVKLKDVVKIARPVPTEKADFKALIEGTLPNIATAQTVNAGSTGADRASNYKAMLVERKLGYMAALKNIRNILQAGADAETIDLLCALFRNEKACLNSKCLPFRFVDAYNEIKELNFDRILIKKIIAAVEDGFKISAMNIGLVEKGEKIAILLDESGSMGDRQGSPFYIGKTLMASMLTGLDKTDTVGYCWSDYSREVSVNGSPFEFIEKTRTQGGGTNLAGSFDGLVKSKTKVDVIVIITDMQQNYFSGNGYYSGGNIYSMVDAYKKISPNVKILFWNLAGYSGGTPLKLDRGILEVSGFSDKLVDVAAKMLKYSDVNFLVKEIEAIKL
jgi:uncharacterized protein with von Willebrand factor type A (vWA) domain